MHFSILSFRRLPLTSILGFWLLLTLLLLSSGPAYAEWVNISSSEKLGGYTAYVDPDTIRRKANLVKMWRLFDLKMTKTLGDISFLSSKGLDEYNCTEEQSRTLASYKYSGQMGNGEIVYSLSDPQKWEPIIPGSVDQTLWEFACGKR